MKKAGTVAELSKLQGVIPDVIYTTALRLTTILDSTYGPDRDVDNDDGGFVLFAENKGDLEYFSRHYMPLENNLHETVEIIIGENILYVEVFFLINNEFGINLFFPASIAPENFLQYQNRQA